jgi:hypothetical protein
MIAPAREPEDASRISTPKPKLSRRFNEREAVEQVSERLAVRIPDVPVETVRLTVRGVYQDLDGPVRDYVPLLVEHTARDVLDSGPAPGGPRPEPR